jgi:anaerobic selenocysteine-containing dehydrogenase
MIGRPVALHAMRGISAHSNGFQTCRAIHMLQILLGSIDCPGGFRFKPPYPKQTPPVAGQPAAWTSCPRCRWAGRIWASRGPKTCCSTGRRDAQRIDKGFRGMRRCRPTADAHGPSPTRKKDPYGIDVLFLYMANMAWNSSMNVLGDGDADGDKDETGEYVIPKIIYSDAYSSEMVAYADLILPDTTYLERMGLHLAARPADLGAEACRRRDPAAGGRARPRRARVPDVLLDLGARLGLPAS